MKKFMMLAAALAAVMLCSCSSKPEENSDIPHDTAVSGSEPDGPVVLHLAICNNNLDGIEKWTERITPFNEADNGCTIELVNSYGENILNLSKEERVPNFEQCEMMDLRTVQDILNTDKIDIVTNFSFNSSGKFWILQSKGAFADLYRFMDSDPEINRDTLDSRILSLNETDGKLYSFPTRYEVRTMSGERKYVGDKENWTVDEMIERYNAAPPNSTFNGNLNAEYVYYNVLRNDLPAFIDYDTAAVHFDSGEFRRLLEFCGSFESSGNEKGEYYYDYPMFVCPDHLSGFHSSGLFSGERTLVGYPTADGSGSYFADAAPRYAINANSSPEKQRAAWEFIHYISTDEALAKDDIVLSEYSHNGKSYTSSTPEPAFPVNKAAFQRQMNDMTSGKYAYTVVCPDDENDPKYFEPYTSNKVDPELCKKLLEYLDRIDCWEKPADRSLERMVTEEVFAYFAGETTLDRCVELIQNRASIWISEQS